MTKKISKQPNTQPSTLSARLDPIMQGRRNRSKRQPQEVPGPEIYVKIEKITGQVPNGRSFRRMGWSRLSG